MNVQIKILDKRLGKEIPMPSYGTSGSAGLDLKAMIEKPLTLKSGQVELISTGLSIYLKDPNFAGFILPRSGLGHKKGLVLGNLVGLIDSDYQGPLMVSLWNRSFNDVQINPGDAIAQYVVMPVKQVSFDIVDEFNDQTKRGAGGFGHTGR